MSIYHTSDVGLYVGLSNLDMIKNADWIIDLDPEGGEKGGESVAEGSPAEIAQCKKSWTGKYLKKYF